jgi:acetyl-CoA carboxylase carboxyltransferase component
MDGSTVTANRERHQQLVTELRALESRLREGGGAARIAREHDKGKLTARERIALLFDNNSCFQNWVAALRPIPVRLPPPVVTGFDKYRDAKLLLSPTTQR